MALTLTGIVSPLSEYAGYTAAARKLCRHLVKRTYSGQGRSPECGTYLGSSSLRNPLDILVSLTQYIIHLKKNGAQWICEWELV